MILNIMPQRPQLFLEVSWEGRVGTVVNWQVAYVLREECNLLCGLLPACDN